MPFDPYMEQALLNWCTGAGAATQPTGRFIGFETGSGQYSASSPAQMFRKTATFQAASTGVSASVSLSAAVTCSPATVTNTQSVIGWALYNSTSAGSRLMYGSITATQTLQSNSGIAFTAPNLIITLA
jgi:hypothetical protein